MAETSNSAVAIAVRQSRWRWTGAPLLLTGILLILAALGALARGGTGFTVLLSFFGTGLALASFGANHDSAIAMAVRARATSGTGLPDALSQELDEELERDRSGTLSLHASPRVALVLPFVAAAVQATVLWRLIG